MLAQDAASLTPADLNTKAQAYFNALYTNTDAGGVTVTAAYTANSGSGSTVALTGAATLQTDFMRLAGYPQMSINAGSTATWGNTKLRVALALDNTGSMASDGKMSAMQTAAKNLITQLSASASSNGDVYISIVPFSRDVNVGSGNYNQNWIRGLGASVVTQFTFAPARIVEYCDEVSRRWPELPVVVGMAGPTSPAALLKFAQRCGVSTSLRALSGQGWDAVKLFMHTDPSDQLSAVAQYRLRHDDCNVVGVHLFSFGSAARAARWMNDVITARSATSNRP